MYQKYIRILGQKVNWPKQNLTIVITYIIFCIFLVLEKGCQDRQGGNENQSSKTQRKYSLEQTQRFIGNIKNFQQLTDVKMFIKMVKLTKQSQMKKKSLSCFCTSKVLLLPFPKGCFFYFTSLLIDFLQYIMKHFQSLRSIELNKSDKYLPQLLTAKAFVTLQSLNDKEEQGKNEKEEKTLNQIFVKIKKQRIRDLFIHKLKRTLATQKSYQIEEKVKKKEFCGFKIEAFEFPQHLVHVIIFSNVIVKLILIVLAVFEGFIPDFQTNKSYAAVLTIKIVCLVISVLYFVLKCTNKSFESSGKSIDMLHKVIWSYLKQGRLILDLITILFQIFTIIFPNLMVISGVFFFFLIIVLIFTLVDLVKIETAYLKNEKSMLIWGLIKVCFSNIFIAHLMGGTMLAMSRIDLEKNWITRVGIQDEHWWTIYFYAFYWGSTIMLTIGFGDVLPGNPREVIITAFLELISCIVLGYNISQIGHIVSLLRQKNETTKKKIAIFQRMVKSNCEKQMVSRELQKNIVRHIYLLNNGHNNYQHQQRAELLAELPQNLRRAYYKEANQRIFSSVLFFNRLKPKTWQKLAEKFENKLYYSGEHLTQTKYKIMVLEKGQIGYGYKRRGSDLNGQIFDNLKIQEGRTQLITTNFLSLYLQQNYSLIAKRPSLVWSIDIQQFLQILQESPIDYQYYYSVKHKHSIDQNQWCSVECSRCFSQKLKSYHIVFNCPRIVYLPAREIIRLKQTSIRNSKEIIRVSHRRKRNPSIKQNALLYKLQFKHILEEFYVSQKRNEAKREIKQFQLSRGFEGEDQPMRKSKLVQYDYTQLEKLFERTIKKYETGYQQDFWQVQSDCLHNYQFYFPNQNVNRLAFTKIQQKYKTHSRNLFRKRTIDTKYSSMLNRIASMESDFIITE